MPVPDFSPGEVLTAAAMDSIGMWLVKTQTIGAGVPSVTVSDAFSATYDNYKILISGGGASVDSNLTFQFAGITTTNYYGSASGAVYTSGAFSGAAINAQTKLTYAGWSGASNLQAEIIVINASTAKNKWMHAQPVIISGTGFGVAVAECNVATAQTGFVIAPTSGTLTGGVIRVYGFRN